VLEGSWGQEEGERTRRPLLKI